MTDAFPFPGAVGLTHLRVYDTAAPDGVIGGSPHVHLASAEAYVPIAGSGQVHTLGAAGEQTFDLHPGAVVWFEPGVIHRLVNGGGLELLVIMQNAGLPEAGDAVFTFPDAIMEDERGYRKAASLPDAAGPERTAAALRRRDLAVEGFESLLAARAGGDDRPLRRFLERAATLKRDRLTEWSALVESGPVAEAARTVSRLDALWQEQQDGLLAARVHGTAAGDGPPGVGMCGLLRGFNLM